MPKEKPKRLKPYIKVIIHGAKIVTKLQRKNFDFNRNVTKSIRDAQILSSENEQNAKSASKEIKVVLLRLIFGAECAIMNLRKRLSA